MPMSSSTTSLLDRLRGSWRILLKEITAFGAVGAFCLVLDLGVFNLLLHQDIGVLTAKCISTVIATGVAYVGNRHLSFSHRARTGLARETSYFFAINIVVLLFSELILGLFAYPLGFKYDHLVMIHREPRHDRVWNDLPVLGLQALRLLAPGQGSQPHRRARRGLELTDWAPSGESCCHHLQGCGRRRDRRRPDARAGRGRRGRRGLRPVRDRSAHPPGRVRAVAADHAGARVRRRGRRASAPRSPTWLTATGSPSTPPCTATSATTAGIGHNNLCERWARSASPSRAAPPSTPSAPAANCVRLPEHVEHRGRRPDRAAVLRGPRLRRAAQPARLARADLRLGHHGPDDAGAGQAHRRGHASTSSTSTPDRLATARAWACARRGRRADELDRPHGLGRWSSTRRATRPAIQDGLDRVAKAGTFLQFGVADYATRATIEPYRIYNQEITITGSMAVLHSYERAAELFAAGVLDPEVFISDRAPAGALPGGAGHFRAGDGLKTQVVPSRANGG